MVAVGAMKPAIQALFYAVAVVLFVVAAFKSWAPSLKARVELVALGLAVFVFVLFWQALAAS